VTLQTDSYRDKDGKWHTTSNNIPFTGAQLSALAQRLSPPYNLKPQPTNPNKLWHAFRIYSLLGVVIIPIFVIGILILPADTFAEGPQLYFCCGGGMWMLFFVNYYNANQKIKEQEKKYKESLENIRIEMPKWEQAMEQWEKLYYCSRDDCVFIPGKNTSAPLGKMIEYIYQE
jgi:hypothetical protein